MGAGSNPEPVKSVGRFVVEIAPRRFEDQRADGTRIARRTDRSLSHPIGKPLETNGFEHVSVHDHGCFRRMIMHKPNDEPADGHLRTADPGRRACPARFFLDLRGREMQPAVPTEPLLILRKSSVDVGRPTRKERDDRTSHRRSDDRRRSLTSDRQSDPLSGRHPRTPRR